MGYMGFGMRKEDYTRKPNKAFNRLKSFYGRELEQTAKKDLPKSSNFDPFHRQRFTHAYQTRLYKFIKWGLILLVGFAIYKLWP